MGQADAREGRPRHEDDRDGGLSGMTETVETTENAARPIPASIPMPDHPIRHTRWWQMFVRLPRPALEWVTVGGIGYALIIGPAIQRSEEHTSELQSLMRISYAVFCLKKKISNTRKVTYSPREV